MGGSGRVPRTDPEFGELETPHITSAVVKVQASKLVLRCSEVDGAEKYEWEVRRSENWPISDHRATDAPRTELTNYPIGLPGVPQVRVRAVGDEALSPYTDWQPSTHDLGITD